MCSKASIVHEYTCYLSLNDSDAHLKGSVGKKIISPVSQLPGIISTLPSVMENSTEEYRIQSFDLDTQILLKTALKGQYLNVLQSVSISKYSI